MKEQLSNVGPDQPLFITPNWLEHFLTRPEATGLFTTLAELPWKRGTIFGHPTPREIIWIGPCPYKFGGKFYEPSDWIPELDSQRKRIERVFGGSYNSVLLNHYRDGKDSVDWHSDDEDSMDLSHPIASISLGATRDFQVRPIANKNQITTYSLESGSLFIMPAGFQEAYQHRVPKTDKIIGPRINLTFRKMAGSEGTHCPIG